MSANREPFTVEVPNAVQTGAFENIGHLGPVTLHIASLDWTGVLDVMVTLGSEAAGPIHKDVTFTAGGDIFLDLGSNVHTVAIKVKTNTSGTPPTCTGSGRRIG